MSRHDRQSFLGTDSDRILSETTVGLVGLGGGGSHFAQQCVHLGIGAYVLCDVILGAPDSFLEREQLERFARRYLIPYIDIGMNVAHRPQLDDHLVSGQIIISLPGKPCLRCCNFITDERIAEEAKNYGDAGPRPQVVWSNGVLASTAIGLMVQLLTPWSRFPFEFKYLEYDANKSTVSQSFWVERLKNKDCSHHPPDETGDPLFDVREHAHRWHAVPAPEEIIPQKASWLTQLKALLERLLNRLKAS